MRYEYSVTADGSRHTDRRPFHQELAVIAGFIRLNSFILAPNIVRNSRLPYRTYGVAEALLRVITRYARLYSEQFRELRTLFCF